MKIIKCYVVSYRFWQVVKKLKILSEKDYYKIYVLKRRLNVV